MKSLISKLFSRTEVNVFKPSFVFADTPLRRHEKKCRSFVFLDSITTRGEEKTRQYFKNYVGGSKSPPNSASTPKHERLSSGVSL